MTRRAQVAPLVDVAWLRAQPPGSVRLLQVDADSTSYYAGHLPEALPLDWYDELHESVRRGPITCEHFETLMRRKGIAEDTHVVLCAGGDLAYAAHAFWVMRYYGHRRLSLLDGGRAAWARAGQPLVDTEADPPAPTGYRSPGAVVTLRATRDEILDRYVGAPGRALVLDCRTPPEYEGRPSNPMDLPVEQHRVPGHIPGAANLPSALLLDEDGSFQPLPRLHELFASRGLVDDSDVVVYCRVAERSSLLWFALSELLAHPDVRHYDGGWAEYGSLMDVDVARETQD